MTSTPRRRGSKPYGSSLADLDSSPTDWWISGLLPLAHQVLLDGIPGVGKSLLALAIAALISIGKNLPGEPRRPAGRVLILNPEDSGAEMQRRLDAAGGDPEQIIVVEQPGPRTPRPIDLAKDQGLLKEHLDEGVALVINEQMALSLRTSTTDERKRETLYKTEQLCRRSGAAVLHLRHFTKGARDSAVFRGAGSMGIIGTTRVATLLAPDPEDPERLVWATTKSNLAPPTARSLEIVSARGVPRMKWLGHSDWTAEDLLRTSNRPATPKRDAAQTLLLGLLANGPVLRSEIVAAAQNAQIGWRTIETAKADLGVVTTQTREPGLQGPGHGWWSLPTEAQIIPLPTEPS